MNLLRQIVFCDFDGTITAVETFAGMLKEFAPQLSAEVMPLLYERKLTLREGVRRILESIPAAYYQDILNYAKHKPIRPGLAELLDYLQKQHIPFVVVSGGLRGMVETVLSHHQLIESVTAIFAVDIDYSQEYLQVHSPFESGDELVAKVAVMNQYAAKQTIAIGDSVTDINMALKADLVFARDRLVSYMESAKKPYQTWDNFFDIRDYLLTQGF